MTQDKHRMDEKRIGNDEDRKNMKGMKEVQKDEI